ncbi:MAG: TetR/AcrR family transcriptional regulator [Planctomycetota bacterium]
MSDLVAQRRLQIVTAAESVISEKGFQHLSLAEIEKKAGMSRGQLTYYFPTKEEILLAVFDRCVESIHRRIEGPLETISSSGVKGWGLVKEVIRAVTSELMTLDPFYSLEYTFLSQVGYRPDFGKRLGELYAGWRARMMEDLRPDLPTEDLGSLMVVFQAFLHGLAIQRIVDPDRVDPLAAADVFVHMADDFMKKLIRIKQAKESPVGGSVQGIEPSGGQPWDLN